jgi:hypothetical protein
MARSAIGVYPREVTPAKASYISTCYIRFIDGLDCKVEIVGGSVPVISNKGKVKEGVRGVVVTDGIASVRFGFLEIEKGKCDTLKLKINDRIHASITGSCTIQWMDKYGMKRWRKGSFVNTDPWDVILVPKTVQRAVIDTFHELDSLATADGMLSSPSEYRKMLLDDRLEKCSSFLSLILVEWPGFRETVLGELREKYKTMGRKLVSSDFGKEICDEFIPICIG